MDKKVFRDYRDAFRLHNIKRSLRQNSQAGALAWSIYMMTIPFITIWNTNTNVKGYLLALAFFIFAILNNGIVSVGLPKEMFLVPMSMEERRRYLRGMLRLKLIVPNLVNAVCAALWTGTGEAPLWGGIALFIAGAVFVVGNDFSSWRGSSWEARNTDWERLKIIYGKKQKILFAQTIAACILACCVYIFVTAAFEPADYDELWVKIMIGIVTLTELTLMVCILRHSEEVVEAACDYEKAMQLNRTASGNRSKARQNGGNE